MTPSPFELCGAVHPQILMGRPYPFAVRAGPEGLGCNRRCAGLDRAMYPGNPTGPPYPSASQAGPEGLGCNRRCVGGGRCVFRKSRHENLCGSGPAQGPSRRRAATSADSSPTPNARHAMSRGRLTSATTGTSPQSSRLCRRFEMNMSHSQSWSRPCGDGYPGGTGHCPWPTQTSGRSAQLWSAHWSCVWTPPHLEFLLRLVRVPVQRVLPFLTGAVGQGPQQGMPRGTCPMGQAPTPREELRASPVVPAAGPRGAAATPRNNSKVDTAPTATDTAGVASSTPGREELRALLVYLNGLQPDLQTGAAQKLHLHLATRLDLPPKFRKSNLRSQYTALAKLLPTRPEVGQRVGQFVQNRRAAPAAPQNPGPDSEGAAKVATASRANQAVGNGKSPRKGNGGPDYNTYSVALMVRWCVNPRYSPEIIYPLSPGQLGMVSKKACGDFRVSYIKDEGQLCHMEDGGWALVGVQPEEASALEGGGGQADKQFTYQWAKANKQPYSGGLLRAHHPGKSNAVLQRFRSGDPIKGPNSLIHTWDRDGAREEGQRRRQSPSMSLPRATRRSEGDDTPRRGSRYPSLEEKSYRGGSGYTPQPMWGPRDGGYDYHLPARG